MRYWLLPLIFAIFAKMPYAFDTPYWWLLAYVTWCYCHISPLRLRHARCHYYAITCFRSYFLRSLPLLTSPGHTLIGYWLYYVILRYALRLRLLIFSLRCRCYAAIRFITLLLLRRCFLSFSFHYGIYALSLRCHYAAIDTTLLPFSYAAVYAMPLCFDIFTLMPPLSRYCWDFYMLPLLLILRHYAPSCHYTLPPLRYIRHYAASPHNAIRHDYHYRHMILLPSPLRWSCIAIANSILLACHATKRASPYYDTLRHYFRCLPHSLRRYAAIGLLLPLFATLRPTLSLAFILFATCQLFWHWLLLLLLLQRWYAAHIRVTVARHYACCRHIRCHYCYCRHYAAITLPYYCHTSLHYSPLLLRQHFAIIHTYAIISAIAHTTPLRQLRYMLLPLYFLSLRHIDTLRSYAIDTTPLRRYCHAYAFHYVIAILFHDCHWYAIYAIHYYCLHEASYILTLLVSRYAFAD